MKVETLLAMAAGAFAYHMYRRINDIEDVLVDVVSEGRVVHLGGSFDKTDSKEDTEDAGFKFGFHA